MNEAMKRFFDELDAALVPFAQGNRLELYLLGRSALVMKYAATFSTKDVDFVKQGTALEEKADELFGKDSTNAKQLGLFLDLVPDVLPPLPAGFENRSTEVQCPWKVIRLWNLEPNDLAATKLKSFRPQDRQDLQFLCDQGVLQADKLRFSLEKAWLWTMEKDGDPLRDRAFANLEKVISYLEGRSRVV